VRTFEFKKGIEALLKNNVIERSNSPYSFGVVLAEKSDGTIRICIDFRPLNDVTIKDSYPLPRIEDLITQLHGAKYFSKIDLASGYHQIKLREQDKQKTAFRTEFGLFHYRVLPFGLTNAPGVFQRMMFDVLGDLVGVCCFIYLDDVVIFAKNREEHEKAVDLVLDRIRKAGLKLQWKKCAWGATEIEYLGYLVKRGEILPAPGKVATLMKYPQPKTPRQVQYKRFWF